MIDADAARAPGCPMPTRFDAGRWLDCCAALRGRRIFSTASAMPTASSISRPIGAAIGPEHAQHAGVSRPCRGDRRRRSGAAVPPGGGAGALVPQHQLQQHAVGIGPRGPADGAGPSRGCAPRSASPTATACASATGSGSVVVHARPFDGLQTRVVIVEGIWPNHAFEEGIGHQSADQRRSRSAPRRRRLPRHGRSGSRPA